MAACTNNGGSRARRAVTAALVGVLSVGAVPMAAVAEGVNDAAATVEDGIATLSADDVTAFENGTAYMNIGGNVSDGYYIQATGENLAGTIKVNQIATLNNQVLDLTDQAVARDFVSQIVTVNEDGTIGSETNEVVNPGTYAVRVTAIDGTYDGGVLYAYFTVKPASLSGATYYEIDSTRPTKLDDTRFIFTGSELNVGIKIGNAALTEGVDYEIKFLQSDMGVDDEGVEVKNEGEYYAVVDGLGIYAGEREVLGTFEVTSFDIVDKNTSFSIVVDPVIGEAKFPEHPASVCYYDSTNDTYPYLDPSYVNLTITQVPAGAKPDILSIDGEYTVSAVDADATDPNVTGYYTDIKLYKYDHEATFEYDDEAFPETFTTNFSDRRPTVFSMWEIGAYNNADEKVGIDVVVTDESGNVVGTFNGTTEDNKIEGYDWRYTPGDYTVKVTAGDKTDYTAGGVATCTVHIVAGTIDADASVFFNYDEKGDGNVKAVSSVETTFDGSDVMDRIQTVVKDADGKGLTEGTDYTVTIKDAEGNVVDGIVNAGSYTVEITVKGYDVTGTTTLPVTVAKKSFDKVITLSSTSFAAAGSNYDYLPWRKGGVPVSDMLISSDVIANFDVTILKDGAEVDEVTDEGVYTLHFEPKTDSVSVNYETPADMEILCAKDGTSGDGVSHVKFVDVTWADHFADAVDWVSDTAQGYMTGYGNTSTFGGWDKITRADVVGTLYKMAGGDSLWLDDKFYDAVVGWESFDDVDGTQYYGRAIAWAKSVGIANGHDGSFRPNDYVTREEFAAFLSNYAELFDPDYEAADSSALDAVSDGDAVSDWFVGAVSWAVENGIMGNAGSVNPSDTIIRGDVAGMIWNYLK